MPDSILSPGAAGAVVEGPGDVLQALNKSLRILDLGCGTGE
jgi:hypothetical protein